MMLPIILITFFVVLLIGLPVAFVMGFSSVIAVISQEAVQGDLIPQRIFTAMDSFSLMAIPFFMLAGELMNAAGITDRLVRFASAIVGHIRGGLAHVTVTTGVMFSGISGSANADASAISSIMGPQLLKGGYNKGFTVSLLACAAALGPIIPPSVLMIIYGNMTNLSIAELFMAGIAPGLIIGILLMVVSYIYARYKGFGVSQRSTLKEVLVSFKNAFWALLMPVIVIGGILTGIFTATEAGVIAVVYGFVLGLVTRGLKMSAMKGILVRSAVTTTVPMLAIGTASIFSWIMTKEQLPQLILGGLLEISTNPYVVLLIIIGVLLVIGLFVESVAAMIMVVPLLHPIALELGYDPIQFALVILLTLIIGGITPPVGMLLYIVCGITKAKMSEVIKPVWVFVGVMLFVVLLIAFIPDILWIPNFFR